MLRYVELSTLGSAARVLVDDTPTDGSGPVMWPSMGEYPVYDASLYQALASDEARNERFRAALGALAPNKVVLDIGTGQQVLWARESLHAGARHAVAMEVMDHAFAVAARNIDAWGLTDVVTLLRGASTELSLDSPADVCVAEIIGSVAGAEGAAVVLDDARRRLLGPGGAVVPHRCVTQAAAVSLRDVFRGREPAFAPEAVPLLERIMRANGGPFDVRLRIRRPGLDAVISSEAAVEILDFNGDLRTEQEQKVTLTIERPGRVDGILTWLRIACLPGEPPLDALRDDTSWASVYFPLFEHEVRVEPGDRLDLLFRTILSDDGTHPDYYLEGTLRTAAGTFSARHFSPHHGDALHSHPWYDRLIRTP